MLYSSEHIPRQELTHALDMLPSAFELPLTPGRSSTLIHSQLFCCFPTFAPAVRLKYKILIYRFLFLCLSATEETSDRCFLFPMKQNPSGELTGQVRLIGDLLTLPGWLSWYHGQISAPNPHCFPLEVRRSVWYQILIHKMKSHTASIRLPSPSFFPFHHN